MLLLRAISVSMAAQCQELVLVVPITIREHGDLHGEGRNRGPRGCPDAVKN